MADLFDVYGIKEGPKVVSAAMAPMPTSKPGEREWGDVALSALKNAPGSAVEFGKALVQPILHPVDTAKGLGELATGVASKLTPAPDWWRGPGEDAADATGQFFKDRYGGMENIKNTLATDPVGVAGDLSAVLSLGGTLPVRGAATLGRAGAMVDPLSAVGQGVKGASTLAGKMAANGLGMTTGAGTEAVKQGFRAGSEGNRVFLDNMRGAPVDEIVGSAKDALSEMRKERGASYRSGMTDISKDATVLGFEPLNAALDKAGEIGSFKGANIAPAANETNAALRKVVKEWETLDPASPMFKDVPQGELTASNFHTPEGLDALKRTVGNIMKSTEIGSPERAAAERVYDAVKGQIEKQAPAYAKVMGDYEKASREIDEVTKTFSLKAKAPADTSARKLLSVMRNNVQTNFGERARLADVLSEHQPNLIPAIAGQAMNSPMPRGLVARGGAMGGAGAVAMDPTFTLAAMLPLTSPRLVGEGAYTAGAAGRKGSELAEALAINGPNARATGQLSFQGGRSNREQETRSLARALMLANERRSGR